MKISVLIANYNNSPFIATSIKSVLSQTFQDFEIIIVDDYSSDNSIDIIESFVKFDSRIKLFKNKRNYGVGYTKRRCIEKCYGDLFAFLDPDDALEPSALKLMVEAHLSNPFASIIYSTHYICDKNLNVTRIFEKSGSIPFGKTFLHATPSDHFQISHFASFKKKYYNLTEGLDTTYKKAADKDLYYKMEEVGEVFFIDKPLYYYRNHSNSISLNNNSIGALRWEIRAKEMAQNRRNKNSNSINITSCELSDIEYNFFILQLKDHFQAKNYFHLLSTSFLFLFKYPTIDSLRFIYSIFFKK